MEALGNNLVLGNILVLKALGNYNQLAGVYISLCCSAVHTHTKDRELRRNHARQDRRSTQVLCCALVFYSSLAKICSLMAAAATALVPPARLKVLIAAFLLLLMAASMARRASSGESPGTPGNGIASIIYMSLERERPLGSASLLTDNGLIN